MKASLVSLSLILFLVSLAILGLLTAFESALLGMPAAVERAISGLLLVLPALVGVALGVVSLRRKEPRPWAAAAGILLNGIFAAFHLLVLFIAG